MKYKYSRDDVYTNRREYYNYLMDNYKNDDIVMNVIRYLSEKNKNISYKDLYQYLYKNNYSKLYRRYYQIIKDILYENNKFYNNNIYDKELKKIRSQNELLVKLTNTFDKVKVKDIDETFEIMKIKKGK